MACSLRVYGNGVSFPGCLWPIIFLVLIFGLIQGPSWWCTHFSVKMISSTRVSGRLVGHIMGCGVSSFLWPLPNSFGWWQLVSSVFLIGTSCREITHASGYYPAWPGWAVSVSGSRTLTTCLGLGNATSMQYLPTLRNRSHYFSFTNAEIKMQKG